MNIPLNRSALIEAMAAGFVPKWCHFWGHRPSQDGRITRSCFSQWWEGHPFTVDGITYPTAEHWMMAGKARHFGDEEALESILTTPNPAVAKKLGAAVRNFDETAWTAARYDLVVAGNAAKFGQHAELRKFLITTGDRILVEASPLDRIWGIGLAATDERAEQPALWQGENLLGFALMEVRRQLTAQLASVL